MLRNIQQTADARWPAKRKPKRSQPNRTTVGRPAAAVTSTEFPAHALSVGLAAERSRPDQTAVLTDSLMYGALFFTVVLPVIIAYFLMGGLPLLVLKHDVPLDARFIRSFVNAYDRLSFWASPGAAVSYAI